MVGVYNSEAYLSRTIEAILAQTLKDFELVLVDDASQDHSVQVCERYARLDTRVKVICLRENSGYSGANAGNIGVFRASGRLLARCDADDMWAPEKLARQIEFMASRPRCVASFTHACCIDANERPTSPPFPGCFAGGGSPRALALRLLEGNFLCHSTAMFDRQIFCEMGGFRIDAHRSTDHDAWLRLSLRGDLEMLEEPLTRYRLHSANDSLKSRQGSMYDASRVLLENFGPVTQHWDAPASTQAASLRVIAFAAGEAGAWAAVQRVLRPLSRLRPLDPAERALSARAAAARAGRPFGTEALPRLRPNAALGPDPQAACSM